MSAGVTSVAGTNACGACSRHVDRVHLMAYDAHHNAMHAPNVPATARLVWSESAEAEITSSLAEISARGDAAHPAYIVTYWYLSRKSASTAALPPSEVWLCVELGGEALPLLLVSTDPPPPRAITAAIAEANVRGPSEAAKAAEAKAKQDKINAEAVAKLSDKLKQREGGWFGLFKHMDADGGGEIEFDELEDLYEKPAPGLRGLREYLNAYLSSLAPEAEEGEPSGLMPEAEFYTALRRSALAVTATDGYVWWHAIANV